MGKDYKLSVATAYFNRKQLFIETLESMEKSKYADDIEVVVVDDGSDEEHRLEDIIENYKFPINLIRVEKEDKWYTNPCIPFNKAFRATQANLILIQNPECFHAGDVIRNAVEFVTDENYLSFACYALDNEDTAKLHAKEQFNTINKGSSQGNVKGWYNHSEINPRPYHFASCISKKNLEELGGFDEKYARGIGYDDDELLFRIHKKGLSISIADQPFVIHQCHYTGKDTFENQASKDFSKLAANQGLYINHTQRAVDWRVNQ